MTLALPPSGYLSLAGRFVTFIYNQFRKPIKVKVEETEISISGLRRGPPAHQVALRIENHGNIPFNVGEIYAVCPLLKDSPHFSVTGKYAGAHRFVRRIEPQSAETQHIQHLDLIADLNEFKELAGKSVPVIFWVKSELGKAFKSDEFYFSIPDLNAESSL